MNDQESVAEYFTQILTLRNQMKNYDEKLEDVMVIGKIMRTLTPRFDYIVVAIEQGTDLEGMKVEEPTGILEAQELRLNERNSLRSSDQALQAQTCKGNSNNGGKNKKGKENGRTKGRTLVKIQAIGTRVIMKKTTRRMGKKVPRKEDEAQLAYDEGSDSDDNVLLMVTTNSEDDNSNLWYLDTGCSNHMIGYREWFVNLDEKVKSKTKFADNTEPTRRKLDDRAIQMVLLGYYPTSAYKLYDPKMRKVVINRDVVVDETRNSTALHPLILCLYVDDLLVTGSNKVEIVEFKKRIMEEFEMTYLRVLSYFHGIKFAATKKGIFIDQKKYATDILKRFNMTNCNPTTTPAETDLKLEKEGSEQLVDAILYKQIVGLLKCLCNSKPDLAYSVDLIRRFMKEPRTPQLLATKRIRRYAKGTLDYSILFPNDKMSVEAEMFGYSNSDWCGDKYDQKSTT
ncbi:uncharacterized protein LOC114370235 [Glycine soja]|uniref:uncharacterized protein LOC114370235 n=1 Tax=Glycine soja TaxID=3848 RepID=UPI00103CB54B|nr:uncharacterized protein LOC114370235 [Glycine soja]